MEPGFWSDQNQARSTMRRLAEQKKTVEQWRSLEKNTVDIGEMIDLATAESDDSFTAEIQQDIENLAVTLDKLELELAFSGEYDSRNAILQIHAGAGGTESQDWAEMLQRMYLRWAEKRGFKTEILDESRGEEVGIKKIEIQKGHFQHPPKIQVPALWLYIFTAPG